VKQNAVPAVLILLVLRSHILLCLFEGEFGLGNWLSSMYFIIVFICRSISCFAILIWLVSVSYYWCECHVSAAWKWSRTAPVPWSSQWHYPWIWSEEESIAKSPFHIWGKEWTLL